jgi:hypothetical protein
MIWRNVYNRETKHNKLYHHRIEKNYNNNKTADDDDVYKNCKGAIPQVFAIATTATNNDIRS